MSNSIEVVSNGSKPKSKEEFYVNIQRLGPNVNQCHQCCKYVSQQALVMGCVLKRFNVKGPESGPMVMVIYLLSRYCTFCKFKSQGSKSVPVVMHLCVSQYCTIASSKSGHFNCKNKESGPVVIYVWVAVCLCVRCQNCKCFKSKSVILFVKSVEAPWSSLCGWACACVCCQNCKCFKSKSGHFICKKCRVRPRSHLCLCVKSVQSQGSRIRPLSLGICKINVKVRSPNTRPHDHGGLFVKSVMYVCKFIVKTPESGPMVMVIYLLSQ